MKSVGRYCAVSNAVSQPDINDEYDVDHVINDVVSQLDEVIEGSDTKTSEDRILVIKAALNHLIEKL